MLLAILILFLLFFLFWQSRKSIFNKFDRINIVFNTIPITVLSLAKNNETAIILLPQNTMVDAVFGFGKYQAGKIFALDKQEKAKLKIAVLSFRQNLGMPIDFAVDFSGLKMFEDEKEAGKIEMVRKIKNLIASMTFFQKSDISLFDKIFIFTAVNNLKPAGINYLDLLNIYALQKNSLADKTVVYDIDFEILNQEVKKIVSEEKIVTEKQTIEILNGTDRFGLAEKASAVVENIGGNVINLANHKPVLGVNCFIYINNGQLDSYTAKRLQSVFHCSKMLKNLPDSRSDISLVLGEKIKAEFSQ